MNRTVKTFGLISILLCNMMGTSTFLSSRNILTHAVSCKLSLLLWFLSAVISLLFGLCYAELGSTYPVAGGDVVYLSKAFSPIVGTFYSICSLLLVLPSCCVLFSRMIHDEISKYCPYELLTTVFVLSLCIIIVIIGSDLLILVGKLSFFLKVLTVLFFLLSSLYTIFIKKIEHIAAFYDSKGSSSMSAGFTGTITAMLYAMWGFDGWNCGNYMANEIFNPDYTFKVGISLSIMLSYVFISIINLSFLLVIPYSVYISEKDNFIVSYLNLLGINLHSTIISFVTVIAPLFGSLLGIVIVYRGITVSLIGNRFKRADLYGVGALLLLSIGYLQVKHHVLLLKFMQICTILFYTLCCYGLIVLRYKKPDAFRPFKVHISIPIVSSSVGTLLVIAFCVVKVD